MPETTAKPRATAPVVLHLRQPLVVGEFVAEVKGGDAGPHETGDYLNEIPGVLGVFELDEAPNYSSLCRWEREYWLRELRRLLRRSAEQAGWSGEAAIDASGFQRDQTSYHYRDRANYSFQSMKTTILIVASSEVENAWQGASETQGGVGVRWGRFRLHGRPLFW